MDNDEEIIVEIKFDGQFMENDKECYMYAMNRAYDLKKRAGLPAPFSFSVIFHRRKNCSRDTFSG